MGNHGWQAKKTERKLFFRPTKRKKDQGNNNKSLISFVFREEHKNRKKKVLACSRVRFQALALARLGKLFLWAPETLYVCVLRFPSSSCFFGLSLSWFWFIIISPSHPIAYTATVNQDKMIIINSTTRTASERKKQQQRNLANLTFYRHFFWLGSKGKKSFSVFRWHFCWGVEGRKGDARTEFNIFPLFLASRERKTIAIQIERAESNFIFAKWKTVLSTLKQAENSRAPREERALPLAGLSKQISSSVAALWRNSTKLLNYWFWSSSSFGGAQRKRAEAEAKEGTRISKCTFQKGIMKKKKKEKEKLKTFSLFILLTWTWKIDYEEGEGKKSSKKVSSFLFCCSLHKNWSKLNFYLSHFRPVRWFNTEIKNFFPFSVRFFLPSKCTRFSTKKEEEYPIQACLPPIGKPLPGLAREREKLREMAAESFGKAIVTTLKGEKV